MPCIVLVPLELPGQLWPLGAWLHWARPLGVCCCFWKQVVCQWTLWVLLVAWWDLSGLDLPFQHLKITLCIFTYRWIIYAAVLWWGDAVQECLFCLNPISIPYNVFFFSQWRGTCKFQIAWGDWTWTLVYQKKL